MVSVIVAIVFCIAGAVITFRLHKLEHVSPTRASAFTTIIIYFFLKVLDQGGTLGKDIVEVILVATFAGSFVGMSSHSKFNRTQIASGGILVFVFIYLFMNNLPVLGGLFGTFAFVACLILYGLGRLLPSQKS